MSARESWGCCVTFQDRLLSEATYTSFGLICFICRDFLQKPPEFCCNKVVLFCLYRPVSLYIWFVAGCMFKLYRCCSLYSVLVFLCAYPGWNGTKPVCFSEEIFNELHKSCLAALKAEPWAVCTTWWILPRAGGLSAALKVLTPCAAGGPQEWAGQWEKSICSPPSAREIDGSVSKTTSFSWIHHFFHLLKDFNLLR